MFEKITAPPLPDSNQLSLAVLPFKQLSSDEESGVLADGVLNEVVSALSGNPDLFVICSGSTARLDIADIADMQAEAQALGVKYYVSGQSQKAGQRVRLSISMIEVQSREVVWGELFDTQEFSRYRAALPNIWASL